MSSTTVPIRFAWRPEYSVGVRLIDTQHQRLFELVIELHQAMAAGEGRSVLQRILDELVSYTAMHFRDEEALMRRDSFPDLAQHIAQHRELTTQVQKLRADYAAGHVALTVKVMDFLKGWLRDHILGSDMTYGKFSRS